MRGCRIAILASLLLGQCTDKKPLTKFSDKVLVQIADAQDKRLGDSLFRDLNSQNPLYRAASALAFGSFRDTVASTFLGNLLLEDPDSRVRKNAAFALGQTGGIASVNALIPALADRDNFVVRQVLEALGKTIGKKDTDVIRNYNPVDTITQEGLSWAFYRLGVRGLSDSLVADREAGFLNLKYSYQTRLAAANFFSRTQKPWKVSEKRLIETARSDPSAEVRMAVVSGLRKLKSDSVWATLQSILQTEKDYRVKVNATRALQTFSFEKTRPLLLQLLNDQNPSVGIAASEVLVNVSKGPWDEVLRAARQASNWRIQANLYKAVLMTSLSQEVAEEIKSKYVSSGNDYQKAWLLSALSKLSDGYPFIRNELKNAKAFIIKSAAAEALVAMNHNKDFPGKARAEFIEIYKEAIGGGDPAVVGIVCSALVDSELGYKALIKDFSFLYEARAKLKLPRDIESLQPLEDAIAYLEGKEKPPPLKNQFNHPIDWGLVESIPANQLVLVKTTKGDIILHLLVEEAPGSVANFVDLVTKKYFDKKYFHRVVPNFVIQTGCNRGDGFGSENYSIRSEFSGRRYTTGSVGMASAGRDTEGTQWFITHSPTPHLDGNYTIFAEVKEGMDVVDKIGVGDQIITISLLDNSANSGKEQ